MRKMIIATEQDFPNCRNIVIILDVQQGVDVEKAVKDACTEYCLTEKGRKVYEGNCDCFNWGDFDTYVPNDICKKYGFEKIDYAYDIEEYKFNQQLVDETDIYTEKE